jgi:hypothetical protein
VNSTSGGLHLLAARPEDQTVETSGPAASTSTGSAASATPSPAPANSADQVVAEPEESAPVESVESWNPEETAESQGDLAQDEELSVLQALERGEIGVDEAAERLDRSGR